MRAAESLCAFRVRAGGAQVESKHAVVGAVNVVLVG
jgi:hypothetical protein